MNFQLAYTFHMDDVEFYKLMGVPKPSLPPYARHQRRTAFRNERNLYKRKCDATGKSIIAVYPQEAPFPVYDKEYWWSDKWDAQDFGMEFDFDRPFFEQFAELIKKVPRFSSSVLRSENCEYNNFCDNSKNCYMCQRVGTSEDAYYSYLVLESEDIIDCYNVNKCKKCYEVIDGDTCYNVSYSQNVTNCSDSSFLFNCRDCRNCFMCVNLRNSEYCYKNKRLSKEEYEKIVKEYSEENWQEFERVKSKAVVPAIWGVKYENVSGNYISECKNTFEAFDCRHCEDIKFAWGHIYGENSMDTDFSYRINNAYEFIAGTSSQNLRFCFGIFSDCHDLTYCMDCVNNSHDLFGCLGMKHASYCILNKQYTKEEYEALVPRIIEHMGADWGEFFPVNLSPFAYNETVAFEYFPLSKNEVLDKGWRWREDDESVGTPDDILETVIICEKSGRSFKMVENELKFYKNHGLSLPKLHPDERYKKRVLQRAPRKTFARKCSKCGEGVMTSYSEESPVSVYCEKCYLNTVY